MPDLTSGSVQANGINFHYLEMGEGPLALCMHGFPDHAYSFRHLLPDFAKVGFRGVAPFMRGGMRQPRHRKTAATRPPY